MTTEGAGYEAGRLWPCGVTLIYNTVAFRAKQGKEPVADARVALNHEQLL